MSDKVLLSITAEGDSMWDMALNHVAPALRAKGFEVLTADKATIYKVSGDVPRLNKMIELGKAAKPDLYLSLHSNAFNNISKLWQFQRQRGGWCSLSAYLHAADGHAAEGTGHADDPETSSPHLQTPLLDLQSVPAQPTTWRTLCTLPSASAPCNLTHWEGGCVTT